MGFSGQRLSCYAPKSMLATAPKAPHTVAAREGNMSATLVLSHVRSQLLIVLHSGLDLQKARTAACKIIEPKWLSLSRGQCCEMHRRMRAAVRLRRHFSTTRYFSVSWKRLHASVQKSPDTMAWPIRSLTTLQSRESKPRGDCHHSL